MTYSNSSLVDHRRLSPNHSGRRTHPIDRITIHHMSGDLSVETCGEVFQPVSRQASSNYGIGSDGRVGLYVEEKNRSWCSSNAENDNRAVTIEVANDGGAETGWHVSDKALRKLIELCADICRRNGIPKLRYTGDLTGNMTMHRWFAATDCPGPYLGSKFPYIAQQVNKKLPGKSTSSGKSTAVKKEDTTKDPPKIYYRVKTKKHGWLPAVEGLSDYAGFEDSPVIAVAVSVSEGKIQYRVHEKGRGWLPFVTGCDIKDYQNGFAGDDRPIDALQIVYTSKKFPKYKARYRVAPVHGNYYDFQRNGEKTGGQDGYAGVFGREIGRVQMTLGKG